MKSNEELHTLSGDYARIERAIRFLADHFTEHPDLDAIAAEIHLSKYHFHRLFTRWAGVTPNRFLQYLTLAYSKELLRRSHSVYDASLAAGLSGGSRLHDLFVAFDGVTPGEYKRRGRGLEIIYGCHPSPFGWCLIAMTQRGICALRFLPEEERGQLPGPLAAEWPAAKFREDPAATLPVIEKIFSRDGAGGGLHLDLRGTNFQMQVWRALLAIPPGMLVSYQDVAESIGRPEAVRAVAGAIAKNPVAYLIPCHRVIRKTGEIHNYRWGAERKRALIGWEASRINDKE